MKQDRKKIQKEKDDLGFPREKNVNVTMAKLIY